MPKYDWLDDLNLSMFSELDQRIIKETVASRKRGYAVRRLDVILPTIVLAVLLAILVIIEIPDAVLIAITVIASSLCVIWALMSVSASLNAQFDVFTVIFKYYAEAANKRRKDL